MELVLRFNNGVQSSVAVVLHIPVWAVMAAFVATAVCIGLVRSQG